MRFGGPDQRAGQGNGRRITLAGEGFDPRASRIAETQYFRGLVERLSGRIVDGSGQPPILADTLDPQDLAMATGDQHQQVGKGEIGIHETRGKRVAFGVRISAWARAAISGTTPP